MLTEEAVIERSVSYTRPNFSEGRVGRGGVADSPSARLCKVPLENHDLQRFPLATMICRIPLATLSELSIPVRRTVIISVEFPVRNSIEICRLPLGDLHDYSINR